MISLYFTKYLDKNRKEVDGRMEVSTDNIDQTNQDDEK